MNGAPLHLLAVDDDSFVLELLQRGLAHHGFEVAVASSPRDAARALAQATADLVLVDVNIPGMSVEDLRSLVSSHATSRFVLFSAADPSQLKKLCAGIGAHAWVSKSSSIDDLARELRKIHGGAS